MGACAAPSEAGLPGPSTGGVAQLRSQVHGQVFLPGEPGATPEHVRTAYEPDTYQELARLKSRFDPDSVFRFTHVIRHDQ